MIDCGRMLRIVHITMLGLLKPSPQVTSLLHLALKPLSNYAFTFLGRWSTQTHHHTSHGLPTCALVPVLPGATSLSQPSLQAEGRRNNSSCWRVLPGKAVGPSENLPSIFCVANLAKAKRLPGAQITALTELIKQTTPPKGQSTAQPTFTLLLLWSTLGWYCCCCTAVKLCKPYESRAILFCGSSSSSSTKSSPVSIAAAVTGVLLSLLLKSYRYSYWDQRT